MRILVVDDDYVSRVKLSTQLSEYGQCDNAPNGEIAVRLFAAAHKEMAPYDLVTMDIEMPDMSGQATVQAMRDIEQALKQHGVQETKILMVTAKTALKEVAESYSQGCNGYLTKPTTSAEIVKALQDLGFQA
ncbi:MAG: response regulator [Candidatus Omnitrophica bacterium]|nr:response regulator [Candidatus Omnitrophota bacterium]